MENGGLGLRVDARPSKNGTETIDIDEAAARRSGAHDERPKLTFVIPTRNEAEGVAELLERLESAISVPTEILFVDDSDDITAFRVQQLALSQFRDRLDIDLVHRTDARREGGLGTAVREGLRRAHGEWVCVIDADLQHPPEMAEVMLERAEKERVDLVVASRYATGGRDAALSPSRRAVSRACALAAKGMFPRRLKDVGDPLSGFFLLRRDAVDPDGLRPHGFKILLEILGRTPGLRVAEVGYEFTERYAGVSKASLREGFRYVWQLSELRATSIRPNLKKRQCLYDIHGIVAVESQMPLPELKRFRVRGLDRDPDIVVTVKRFDRRDAGELIDLTAARPHIRYDEVLGHRGFVLELDIDHPIRAQVSPFVARSPHVLYTNVVEPILRWTLVERGFALVHAACFTYGGQAHFITARTDTGKTTSMLKILEHDEVDFVSDDLTLIDELGRVHTYPKPLTISNHTVHALKGTDLNRIERLFLPLQSKLHSREGRQFAFLLAEKNVPVASLNAFVQRLVPPPKYHVEKLVPGVKVTEHATIGNLFIIQRGDDDQHELELSSALETLLENCEDAYGFPPYSSLETALTGRSDISLPDEERRIIASAFGRSRARLITSSHMGWAEDIWDVLSNEQDGELPEQHVTYVTS